MKISEITAFLAQENSFIMSISGLAISIIGTIISILTLKRKSAKIIIISIMGVISIICIISIWCYLSDNSTEGGGDFSSNVPYAQFDEKTDKWGYINGNGETIIPYKYDYADEFIDGYAAVMQNYKWGFIDKNGNEAIPFEYDGAFSFINGFAPVYKNELWGFIDEYNNLVIPFKYSNIARISEKGKTIYLDENNNAIDYTNGIIINEQSEFDETSATSLPNSLNGKTEITSSDKNITFIEESTKVITTTTTTTNTTTTPSIEYTDGCVLVIETFESSMVTTMPNTMLTLYADNSNEKWGYIDENGNEQIPYIYNYACEFIDEYAAVMKNYSWGFIDKNGNTVIPFEYNGAFSFVNGLAPVYKDELWGFIDEKNNIVIPFQYKDIALIYSEIDDTYMYLDENNNEIIYPNY